VPLADDFPFPQDLLPHGSKDQRCPKGSTPGLLTRDGESSMVGLTNIKAAVTAHSVNFLGDVIYYNTPGTPVLLLNSRQAMSDLLDKRADIYSSRPYRTMVIDM
jgi:hypothetical protein